MTDFRKSPEEILTELINQANGTALQASALSFAAPQDISGPGARRNTKVSITGIPAQGAHGAIELQYNRVHINTVPGTRSRTFPKGSLLQTSELVGAINAAYGIQLRSTDVVNVPLPTEGELGQLQIVPGSLVYYGSLDFQMAAAAPEPDTGIQYLFEGTVSMAGPGPLMFLVGETSQGAAGLKYVINGVEFDPTMWLPNGNGGSDVGALYMGDFHVGDTVKVYATQRDQLTQLGLLGAGNLLSSGNPLPDDYFTGMTGLYSVLVQDNSVPGTVPFHLQGVSTLRQITLSASHLSGEVPTFMYMRELTSVDLNDNQLTGEIPQLLGTKVSAAYFQNNQFSTYAGSLPDTLQFFSAANNQLDQAAVDRILEEAVRINNNTTAGRMIDLSGGTNAAPSAAGALNAQVLVDTGWNVMLNGWTPAQMLGPWYYISNFEAQTLDGATPMVAAQNAIVYLDYTAEDAALTNWLGGVQLQLTSSLNGNIGGGRLMLQPTQGTTEGATEMSWSDYLAQFGDALPLWPAPTLTVSPVLSGSFYSGETVSVTPGTWEDPMGGTLSFAYQWRDNGTSLPDTSSDSYTLPVDSSEVGHQVSVTIIATSSLGRSAQSMMGPFTVTSPP